MRAGGKIQTGERLEHFLPGFGLSRGVKLFSGGVIRSAGFLEVDEGPGQLQFGLGVAGGHEAVVADFDKPGRENVQQKAADKLRGGKGHQPLLPGPGIVPGLEGDLARGQTHQAVIGDGHPVGVAAEVMIGFLGAAESRLGVDDPLFAPEFPEEALRLHRVFKTGSLAPQSALTAGLLQGLDKLTPDDLGERLNG